MDSGFVTAKKRTTIIHVGSHFSLGSAAQPKLFVIIRILAAIFFCNQPNLSRFSWLRDNSANPNISRIFPQPSVFFSDCRLGV